MHLACCFPYSNLERAETKMVICLGEVVGEVTPAVEIKSVAHQEAEEGFLAPCGLVPLKTAPLTVAGGVPEVRGHGKRDADFLIADGGRMVYKNAKIGIDTEDRESKPI